MKQWSSAMNKTYKTWMSWMSWSCHSDTRLPVCFQHFHVDIYLFWNHQPQKAKEEKIIDRRMKPIETHSRQRARLLKDWGHWKYHFHDLMTSNPWFTGIALVMLLMVCSENFPKALVSQNFNVVLVVVDEVDEEELELPEELNWFELSWGMTMTNSYSVSLSLLTFRQQKSTNVTHKASRKTRGKFGKEKHKNIFFELIPKHCW